jgi:hypothetical protein
MEMYRGKVQCLKVIELATETVVSDRPTCGKQKQKSPPDISQKAKAMAVMRNQSTKKKILLITTTCGP